MDRERIIESAVTYVKETIGELSDEYWEAYYWRQSMCRRKGRRFDWHAGCRVRETESGARLEWFMIEPTGKGKRAGLQQFQIYKKGTNQYTKEFAALEKEQKRLIRALTAREREAREVAKTVEGINRQTFWLDRRLSKLTNR